MDKQATMVFTQLEREAKVIKMKLNGCTVDEDCYEIKDSIQPSDVKSNFIHLAFLIVPKRVALLPQLMLNDDSKGITFAKLLHKLNTENNENKFTRVNGYHSKIKEKTPLSFTPKCFEFATANIDGVRHFVFFLKNPAKSGYKLPNQVHSCPFDWKRVVKPPSHQKEEDEKKIILPPPQEEEQKIVLPPPAAVPLTEELPSIDIIETQMSVEKYNQTGDQLNIPRPPSPSPPPPPPPPPSEAERPKTPPISPMGNPKTPRPIEEYNMEDDDQFFPLSLPLPGENNNKKKHIYDDLTQDEYKEMLISRDNSILKFNSWASYMYDIVLEKRERPVTDREKRLLGNCLTSIIREIEPIVDHYDFKDNEFLEQFT